MNVLLILASTNVVLVVWGAMPWASHRLGCIGRIPMGLVVGVKGLHDAVPTSFAADGLHACLRPRPRTAMMRGRMRGKRRDPPVPAAGA